MTCVNSCQSVLPQLNASGFRADGESITKSFPKQTPRRAEAGRPRVRTAKVRMVGIHFKGNRTFRREFVFRGERLVGLLEQIGDVRPQRRAFLLVQLDVEMLG